MILTLNAACLRPLVAPEGRGAKPTMTLNDLPGFTREVLGLRGLNLATELLAGADRKRLEQFRERADKAGCACLVLVESEPLKLGDPDDNKAAVMVARMVKVVQAAQLLGCSGSAFYVQGLKADTGRDAAARRLKAVVERAERLDVNVLVSPWASENIEPEHVTDLLKKVGGFRVGTYPDFETAAKAKDPVAYLRRLSPYASGIAAATVEFRDPEQAEAAPKSKKAPKAAPAPAPEPEPTPGKAGKGSKAAAKPGPVEVEEPEEEGEAGEEEELDLRELEELAQEAQAAETPPPEPPPVHVTWDLPAMVAAVASVGYDGPLAIDYRGKGDLTIGVTKTRRALQAALDGVYSGA